ncbi:MAG: hypothetical protein ABIK09_19060 [Pseudomonadota bacterium]
MRFLSRGLAILTLLPLVGAAGCGGDAVGDGGGAAPSSSCLQSMGDGEATIAVVGAPQEIAEATSQAMNTLDEEGSPITGRLTPPLAVGLCGTAGLIYLDGHEGSPTLFYLDVTAAGGVPEVVDPSVSWSDAEAALLFDAACTPHVIGSTLEDTLVDHARGKDGGWTPTIVAADAALGGAPDPIRFQHTDLSGDGSMRVLGTARVANALTPFVASRGPGGAWAITAYPPHPEAQEVLAWAPANDGSIHAVYRKPNTYPCDPCDMNLYWGKVVPGGTWEEGQVTDTVWGKPDDRFTDQPDLAITAAGEPVIVGRWQRRAATGSIKESELRVYAPAGDGAWCYETIATKPDGYGGGDGEEYTGEMPQVAVDGAGRIHVAFHDLAEWHDANSWENGIQGQLRYALRDGTSWTVTTLLKQPGQSESPSPLHGFVRGMVAPTSDGTAAFLTGIQRIWETDSIYNDSGKPITFKAQVFRATVTD